MSEDWRERLRFSKEEIQELSVESSAAHRIMKSLGVSKREIGNLCKRFEIPYNEEDTTFDRAVQIFRAVYNEARLVEVFDAKTGKREDSIYDDLLDDTRTGIVFYKINGQTGIRAFVKGPYLSTSPLGAIVIKPGIKYLMCKDGMQLWEQEPVTLLKSFSKLNGD